MYAIIETGGKQVKVAVGDKIYVEKLDVQPGSEKLRAGIFGEKLVKIGGPGLGDRVARGGRCDPEAIHDNECCFFAHKCHVLLFSRPGPDGTLWESSQS